LTEVPTDGMLNDASLLSATPVHRHSILTQDPGAALSEAIRAEMREARAAGRCVNVGAARHSMGGQAIPRDGHALTFANGVVEIDSARQVFRAHAGARWSQVIAALDPAGFSPMIMQSNNDFGVAATFCVNAHGWPVPFGPMGASVEAIEMILPSGEDIRASRSENADLFNMAYGRLNVDRAHFFEEALLITYRPADVQDEIAPASGSGLVSHLARHLYRAQLGNEPMKRLRWFTETTLGPRVAGGVATRNSLINEPVATLDDRDSARTDILHECFVAPERFGDFLTACREIIPVAYQEFLNVTLRFVDRDAESWLSYATTPRIAAVMSFSQEMSARAEADMARMTRALIDAITAIGGSYYLPYRPHATPAQMAAAYARAPDFARAKRALDPDLLFRNALWDGYLEVL
jgi:FAD/FMN-containing dehydrogenase